jgi:hypothetical protein
MAQIPPKKLYSAAVIYSTYLQIILLNTNSEVFWQVIGVHKSKSVLSVYIGTTNLGLHLNVSGSCSRKLPINQLEIIYLCCQVMPRNPHLPS